MTGARETRQSIEIVPLEPWHILAIDAQQEQEDEARRKPAEYGRAWAALWCGTPVAAGGFVELWEGRWYAWALFGKWWPHKSVIRAIRSHVEEQDFPRLEMAVDAEFERAQRFAEWLGFELENKARRYLPNGHDAMIYVRLS